MIRKLAGIALLSALALIAQIVPVLAAEPTEQLSVVVKITDPAGVTDITAIATDFGAMSIDPMIPSRGIYRVWSPHTVEVKDDGSVKLDGDAKKWVKDTVGKHPSVVWSEVYTQAQTRDERFHAWPQAAPELATATDLASQPSFEMLQLAEAHSLASGTGARIAVLDTGIDATHPLLLGHFGPGYDLIDDDANPSEVADGFDDDGDGHIDEAFGHGTFIAGLIAQIAPGAEVLPIRVLDADGQGDLYTVVEGIDLAVEMGADIINMSFSLPARGKSDLLDATLKRAAKAGVVVIAAAGNSGIEEEHFPAAHKNVISVTALAADGTLLAPFSNHGKWVHIAAPGVDVVSAVPGGGYARWSGTSMATPVVASLTALLIDYAPDEEGKKVQKAVLDGARKMKQKVRAEKGIIDMVASFTELD